LAREIVSILNEFGGLMHARVKKLNSHANTPAAAKMNEINPKYENTRKIHPNHQIHSEYFNHCLTKQIKYS
jgi:hypothetical protein